MRTNNWRATSCHPDFTVISTEFVSQTQSHSYFRTVIMKQDDLVAILEPSLWKERFEV